MFYSFHFPKKKKTQINLKLKARKKNYEKEKLFFIKKNSKKKVQQTK